MYDHHTNTENVTVTVSCTIIIQTLRMQMSRTISMQKVGVSL